MRRNARPRVEDIWNRAFISKILYLVQRSLVKTAEEMIRIDPTRLCDYSD